MPLTQVFYSSPSEAVAVTPVAFVDATTNQAADPTSITCVLTDPTGAITNFTYTPNNPGIGNIQRVTTGNYTLTAAGLTVSGLYSYTWVGTGNNVQAVIPGTFRLVPLTDVGTGMKYWYTGLDELKHRLNINDSRYDYEAQLAIQTVTSWINNYCGRHFYRLTETRTFVPESVWGCGLDDIPASTASSIQVNLDYQGNGQYSVAWTQGQQYQLRLTSGGDIEHSYNVNAAGVPRPYRHLQVLTGISGVGTVQGGGWLPWLWPYTYMNRVQVIGTWGWDTVPPPIQQASMMLAVDLYKSKDAPWGVAGVSDLGIVKVQSNPWVVELMKDFIDMRRKAGV